MNRYIAMWAFIALAAQFSYSSEPLKADEDTFLVKSEAIELMDITVKASSRIQKPDRMVFLPKREVVRTSTDGIDLLRKMHIPGVSINPLTGEINVSGGREVELRLNGSLVSNVELAGVQPPEIIRIEYNDNSGAGSAQSRVVINYVVRTPESGGYFGFDSFDAVGKDKFASISHLSGRYASGQSCLTINAGYFGMTRAGWIRDYEEIWHLPMGDITRLEQGLPVKIGVHGVDSYLNYNLSGDGKYIFNARLGLDYNYVPNKEEGDRHTLLFIDGETIPREITEHTSERSWTPSANLFYRINLSDLSTLTFELTGAHMTSSSLHSYAERGMDYSPQKVQYEASGRKSSLRSEGKWTLRLGKGELTTGFRDENDRIRNVYTGDTDGAINLEQNVASVFGNYGVSLGIWNFSGGLSADWLSYSQTDSRMACFALNPLINVGVRPAGSWWLRYSFGMGKKMPTAAEMTDMDQIIQPGMIRRGNPDLEAFTRMRHEFSGGWEGGFVQVDANISFLDERHPVMESIQVEHNSLVRIYENQRYFRRLSAEATFTVRPWRDHLSIWVSPLVMHYMSGGLNYSHRQSLFRLRLGLDFSYGNWIFMAQTLSGPANDMYGEEIIEEKDMNQIMAGYKRPEWSVQAGAFNAFMNSYSMTTRNLSALAPYTSKAHCGHNTYFAVKVSVALNFGRRHLDDDDLPELMEIDGDSGLANGLKSYHN